MTSFAGGNSNNVGGVFVGMGSQLSSISPLINSGSLLHSVALMSTDGVGHLPQTPISATHWPRTSVWHRSFTTGALMFALALAPLTGRV